MAPLWLLVGLLVCPALLQAQQQGGTSVDQLPGMVSDRSSQAGGAPMGAPAARPAQPAFPVRTAAPPPSRMPAGTAAPPAAQMPVRTAAPPPSAAPAAVRPSAAPQRQLKKPRHKEVHRRRRRPKGYQEKDDGKDDGKDEFVAKPKGKPPGVVLTPISPYLP